MIGGSGPRLEREPSAARFHAYVSSVPYRIDLSNAGSEALDRLIGLGALDAEILPNGVVAALMPDGVTPGQVQTALGISEIRISPAVGRDGESVWLLNPPSIRIAGLSIVPAHTDPAPGILRLVDAAAFGTGLHPTTALCLETLAEMVQNEVPGAVLDVGTGSGVLALAALTMGVPRAVAIDIDPESLRVARENARLNALDHRLQLALGGPDTIAGAWPLVLANVLAAPLIEMAPVIARRVGHHGRLVLSGIPRSVEEEVERAYRHLGMRRVRATSRGDWVALVMQASW